MSKVRTKRLDLDNITLSNFVKRCKPFLRLYRKFLPLELILAYSKELRLSEYYAGE